MRYFVMIKRKGGSRYIGAIPAKRGVGKMTLRKSLARRIKRGYAYRIVTEQQLKAYLRTMVRKARGMRAARPRRVRGRVRRVKHRRTRRTRRVHHRKGRRVIRKRRRR